MRKLHNDFVTYYEVKNNRLFTITITGMQLSLYKRIKIPLEPRIA